MTLDFQINKKIAEEVALIPSKRIRNKVAGFITVRTPQPAQFKWKQISFCTLYLSHMTIYMRFFLFLNAITGIYFHFPFPFTFRVS